MYKGSLRLHPALARLRAQFYEDESVISEDISATGEYLLDINIQRHRLDTLLEKEGLTLEQVQ